MHIFLFVFVNAFTANSTAFSSRAFICISFSTAVHRPWVLFLPQSLFTLLAFSLSLFCSSELRGILAVFSPSSLPVTIFCTCCSISSSSRWGILALPFHFVYTGCWHNSTEYPFITCRTQLSCVIRHRFDRNCVIYPLLFWHLCLTTLTAEWVRLNLLPAHTCLVNSPNLSFYPSTLWIGGVFSCQSEQAGGREAVRLCRTHISIIN